MKKRLDYRWLLSDEAWVKIAVSFAIIGIVCTIILLISILYKPDSVCILKDLTLCTFGAAAFSFGFCLTIRHTRSVETQAEASKEEIKFKQNELKLRKEQLEEDRKRHDFDKLKMLFRCLDGETIVSLDAISELHKEAINADKNNQQELVLRIVLIFEFFIKKYSNVDKTNMSALDKKWEGAKIQTEPSIAIQTIIRILFNRDTDNPFKKIGRNINLTRCNLQVIDFTGLLVENVDFGYSALHAARMYSNKDDKSCLTQFRNCEFCHTQLQGANMSNTTFEKCNFTHANLIWVNMCESTFKSCKFVYTDMTACLMSKANMDNNEFISTILDACDIYGINENTPVLTNKNTYQAISLCCAFVYPQGEIFKNQPSRIINLRGCEHDKTMHRNPENRLSRLIRYSNQNYALTGASNKYKFKDLTEKNKALILIYKKILKYAQEDESAGLRCDTFNRLRNEMDQIYKSISKNEA